MENSDDLNRLLEWLGGDTAAGARRYLEVREKLILMFRFRGSLAPEELADETIDRTARAIAKPGFTYEGNPIAYLRGVAKNVLLESLRRERRFAQEPIEKLALTWATPENDSRATERLAYCLERCLARLPADKMDLLLDYYRGEKRQKIERRKAMSQSEGGGINALRIQIFRLRNQVRSCIEKCIPDA